MTLPPPNHFHPQLTSDRLSIIAAALLDIRYEAIGLLQGPYDDNYTRETTAFGRSRNKLIELCRSGKYDWLDLRKPELDVTFTIGGIPCRFFRDDPIKPDKRGFFKRNQADDLFAWEQDAPVMWRFIVEAAVTDEDEDRVFFAGYSQLQEKVSEWAYQSGGVILHSVDNRTPVPVRIPLPEVGLLDDDEGAQAAATAPTQLKPHP